MHTSTPSMRRSKRPNHSYRQKEAAAASSLELAYRRSIVIHRTPHPTKKQARQQPRPYDDNAAARGGAGGEGAGGRDCGGGGGGQGAADERGIYLCVYGCMGLTTGAILPYPFSFRARAQGEMMQALVDFSQHQYLILMGGADAAWGRLRLYMYRCPASIRCLAIALGSNPPLPPSTY